MQTRINPGPNVFITNKQCIFLLLILLLSIKISAQENYNTSLVGSFSEGPTFTVAQNENLLFFNNGCYLEIFDQSNPEEPVLLSRYEARGFINDIFVSNSLVYIAVTQIGLSIIDISDIQNPFEKGFTEIPKYSPKIKLLGESIIYCSSGSYGLDVVDVSNPASPQISQTYETNGIRNFCIKEDLLYASCGWYGLKIFDISDPSNFVEIYANAEDYIYDFVVEGNIGCLATGDTVYIMDISIPTMPVTIGKTAVLHTSKCEIRGSNVFVSGYNLRHIDISDPSNPQILGTQNVFGYTSDLSIQGNKVYVATETLGLQGFEIKEDGNLELLKEFESIGITISAASYQDYAYLGSAYKGIHILNIADPANPIFDKTIPNNDYVAQIKIVDHYLIVCADGLIIYDLSEPSNPVQLSYFELSRTSYGLEIINDLVYLSAGSLGLFILDISDKSNPIQIGQYDTPGTAHNADVHDNMIYVADRDGGLRILDASDLSNPVETGSIDINAFTPLNSVRIFGNYAWIGSSNYGLKIYDISDLSNPVFVRNHNTSRGYNMQIKDQNVYVCGGSTGMHIFNTQLPSNPEKVGFYNSPGNLNYAFINDEFILLADEHSGLTIIEFDKCAAIDIDYEQQNASCFNGCDAFINIINIQNALVPYAYSWSSGETANSIQDLCSGSYTLTFSDAQGCVLEQAFYVTKPDELQISSITIEHITDTNSDASINITVDGGTPGYDYHWSGPDDFESTAEDLNNLLPGCYMLSITDANDCSLLSEEICIEDQTTAIDDLSYEELLDVFPNPASDYIHVKIDGSLSALTGADNLQIWLIDPKGIPVLKRVPHENSIDLSLLPNGIYFLKIKSNQEVFSKKISICH